jgi:ATP-binding cassette subfamily C protein CydD
MVSAFAECLPEGLDTKIGENGLGLSGGEAQRVALARLYLRDPRLILLDEPTSHLDWKAERQVLDCLMAFASGRTLLVTTHSEAVAARMDRVFRIVHRQLLPAPRPRVWEGLTERGAA